MKLKTIFTTLLFILNLGIVYSQVAINQDSSTPDTSAILDVKSTTKGMLFPRMTEAQRDSIGTPATGLMIYQTDETAGPYYYNGSTWMAISVANNDTTYYAGELYGGGVVFWVDHSGQHGLIVSPVDLKINDDYLMAWSNVTNQAVNTSNWDGASNTTAIIAQSGHTSSAAKVCHDYTNHNNGTGVYSDWYLPSVAEFILIWKNFYVVQKSLFLHYDIIRHSLTSDVYWSSSELNAEKAYYIDRESMQFGRVKNGTCRVRAIRAF